MKYGGIKWISGNPFYVHLRKHYCPDCYTQLGTIKISRVVNSASEEAKNLNFKTIEGVHMTGNIKVIWTKFKCPKCEKQIEIDEMRQIESGL